MGVESELWGEGTSAVKSAVEQTCGSVWTRLAPGVAPTCWPGDGESSSVLGTDRDCARTQTDGNDAGHGQCL